MSPQLFLMSSTLYRTYLHLYGVRFNNMHSASVPVSPTVLSCFGLASTSRIIFTLKNTILIYNVRGSWARLYLCKFLMYYQSRHILPFLFNTERDSQIWCEWLFIHWWVSASINMHVWLAGTNRHHRQTSLNVWKKHCEKLFWAL